MSVSKPFVFALVCEQLGPDALRDRDRRQRHRAAVQLARGRRAQPRTAARTRWSTPARSPRRASPRTGTFLHDGLSRFAGRELPFDDEVYASASATNARNQAHRAAAAELRPLYRDPSEAVDLYTRQCSLRVSARDLAVMGATLADGGVNPVTGERVIDAAVCHYTLAVMLTAGLYETSGDWLYDVGLPAKSGIGGGIVTVSPGKGGMGTFAPPLDAAGNSVKGQLVARFLSARLGMDLLISAPDSGVHG